MDESSNDEAELDAHEGDSAERAFAEGDLGTIQSILFGSQAQQLEERMAELDSRIQANNDTLRAQIRSELHASEDRIRLHVDGGVSELRAAAMTEQQSRLEAIDDLQHLQREHTKELTEAIGAVEHEAERSMHEMNKRFEHRASELAANLRAVRQQIESTGDETRSELQALASEREVLAELLERAAQTVRSMDVRADET